jgi:hypothetical protein
MKDDVVTTNPLSDAINTSDRTTQAQDAVNLTSKGQGRPLFWLDLPYEEHAQTLADQLSQSFHLHLINWTERAPADLLQRAALLSELIPRIIETVLDKTPVDVIAQGEACQLALYLARNKPDQIGQLVLQNPILSNQDQSLSDIAARSLILIGTKASPAIQTCGRWLKANLRPSHLIYIHEAGDSLSRTQPERTSRVMIDFLNRGEVFLVREN